MVAPEASVAETTSSSSCEIYYFLRFVGMRRSMSMNGPAPMANTAVANAIS